MNVTCIRAGVKDLPSDALVVKAGYIEDCMAGNPHFPAPMPSLAALAELREQLSFWLTEAEGGAHAAVATRWSVHAKLERALVQLSKYVMAAAQGDIESQLTSGFEMRNPPYRITTLEAPKPLFAKHSDHEGCIELQWSAVHGARTFQVSMNAQGEKSDETWQLVHACTRRRTVIKGLAKTTFYWFRVQAVGAAGVSPWSNTATVRTL